MSQIVTEPVTEHEPEPAAAVEQTSDAQAKAEAAAARPTKHWSDPFAFLVAIVLQASGATIEALGFRHPLRIPAVLFVWAVTTAFLGLPTWVLTNPTLADVQKYGNWRRAGWLAAVLEVGALFIFQVIFSAPRLARARKHVPLLGVATLISRGESLYWMRISSEVALKGWMERVKAWTNLVERELSETISPQEADDFRRPSVMQVHKHQQRFNEAHNGWLDLLAKRLDVLRGVSGRLKPRKHYTEPPDDKS